MAKGSLFWGTASGKLGEAVFYRAKSEQRTRSYVKNVGNPKTPAQMVNRIQMSPLSAFWKRAEGRLKDSMLKKSNQSDFNRFVQVNKAITPYMYKVQSGTGLPGWAPYVISEGDAGVFLQPSVQPAVQPPGGSNYVAMVSPFVFPELATASSWGEIWADFLYFNSNLASGDKITIFVYTGRNGGELLSKQYTIDPSSTEPFTYSNPVGTPDMPRSIVMSFHTIGGVIQPTFDFVDSGLTVAGSAVSMAVVLTKRNNAGVSYQSTSSFGLNPLALDWYNQARSESELQLVLESYGVSRDIYLSWRNAEVNPAV